jgi:hypothetical protein
VHPRGGVSEVQLFRDGDDVLELPNLHDVTPIDRLYLSTIPMFVVDLPIRRDVTDRAAAVDAVKHAAAHFGRLGKAPLDVATQDYESRLATWNEWQPVSVEAYGA